MSEVLKLFPKEAQIYYTQSHTPRSLPVKELKEQGDKLGLRGTSHPNVNLARWEAHSRASKNDLILITGSNFVIAELEDL